MAGMLIAWDANGDIIATFSFMARRDEDGEIIGHYDFSGHEAAGGALTDLWVVKRAVASGTWPEFIGLRAHDFRVDLDAPGKRPRVKALVHRASGHRRERAVIEAKIQQRRAEERAKFPPDYTGPVRAYIGDIVGGPGKSLLLNDDGTDVDKQKKRFILPDVPYVETLQSREKRKRGNGRQPRP